MTQKLSTDSSAATVSLLCSLYSYPSLVFFLVSVALNAKLGEQNHNGPAVAQVVHLSFFPTFLSIEYTFFMSEMQCEFEYKSHQLCFPSFFFVCAHLGFHLNEDTDLCIFHSNKRTDFFVFYLVQKMNTVFHFLKWGKLFFCPNESDAS